MTMMVQGRDYEDQPLFMVFQTTREYQQQYLHSHLTKWIAQGNRILVKLDKGARAGTVGELVLPENLSDLYEDVKTYQGNKNRLKDKTWTIKFDDSDKTVKLEGSYRKNVPGTVTFVQQPTVWCYTSKERPKVELPELHDHFGVPLEVGQICLALVGKGTDQFVRLGKITRWSAAGTIWIETMKTHANHRANQEVTVKGSINIFVLDGDIRNKAMIAKMAFS